MAGIFAQDERGLLWGSLLQALHELFPPRGNKIFSNGELGIDLWPDEGVTLNDLGDGDTGADHLQNYPVLSAAAVGGDQMVFKGSLNSIAASNFVLDFYASSICDPSGYGEGEFYLGTYA